MFLKKRSKNENKSDGHHSAVRIQNPSGNKSETEKKSLYFENIARTNDLIDLEKELQSYNELLI